MPFVGPADVLHSARHRPPRIPNSLLWNAYCRKSVVPSAMASIPGESRVHAWHIARHLVSQQRFGDIDMKQVERLFERLLWNSRLITLVAVVASLAVAVVMFYIATADVAFLSQDVLHLRVCGR